MDPEYGSGPCAVELCPICGGGQEVEVFWNDQENGDIVICSQCGVAFNTQVKEKKRPSSLNDWNEPLSSELSREYIHRKIVRWITGNIKSPGSILDVGSGRGLFLSKLCGTWRMVGIEPSEAFVKISREMVPSALILHTSLSESVLPELHFDIVTIISTIHFLNQPVQDLKKVIRSLNTEGILIIEAQNFANRGWIYRWKKQGFAKQWGTIFFSPWALESLLNQVGMVVIERINLPCVRAQSLSILWTVAGWFEYFSTLALKGISRGRFDFVPRYILIAKRLSPVK